MNNQDDIQQYFEDKAAEYLYGCPWFSVRVVSRLITQYANKALEVSGLTITQMAVLLAVANNQPATVSVLSEVLTMDQTSVSRTLKPLIREGHLRILQSDEDGRVRYIHLMPSGQERLLLALPAWDKGMAHIVHEMGDDNLMMMNTSLSELAQIIRESE